MASKKISQAKAQQQGGVGNQKHGGKMLSAKQSNAKTKQLPYHTGRMG